jgi:hypothetical protein
MKICLKCKETKELSLFPKNKLMSDGLHYYCKQCNNDKAKAYRQNNLEKCREKDRIRGKSLAKKESNQRYIKSALGKETRRKYNQTEERKQKTNAYKKTVNGKLSALKTMLKLNLANSDISQRTLKAWSIQIKKRDQYSCRYCGSSDKLHAHHILSKIKHPELALNLDNGLTLCSACHIEEHRINGEI